MKTTTLEFYGNTTICRCPYCQKLNYDIDVADGEEICLRCSELFMVTTPVDNGQSND